MQVPLLELTSQNGALSNELNAACARVLASGQYIMGPEITGLEAECSEWIGCKHALGVSSGTDAILLILMGLGIGPGDEVIVPSFTFFATAGCVSRVGATPVFADCCSRCFNMRRSDVEPLITERTKAIMPVHLFGQSAPMDELLALAEERGLALIEDAAQAIGSTYKGRQVGSMGTAGAFSFFPSKNLGGLGDSGLVTTNDDELADRMTKLRVHGGHARYYHDMIGGNFRMDPLQATLLRIKLPHLQSYIDRRRQNAAFYHDALAAEPGVITQSTSSDCECNEADARLILPVESKGHLHTYNQFTLRVRGEGQRDAVFAHLQAHNIGCAIYYPVPLHQQKCFANLPSAGSTLPHTEQLAQEVLSIPIYPELGTDQLAFVADALKNFLQNK